MSRPATSTFHLAATLLLLPVLTACGTTPMPGTNSSFVRYAGSIDTHVREFIGFSEPDKRVQNELWQKYQRAKALRDQYHTATVIPDDPLVHRIEAGTSRIPLSGGGVAILLSSDPTLECAELKFTKEAGSPAHMIVIGGNRRVWREHDSAAKFISATVTLPRTESELTISSQSFSPAKIVVAVGVGVAIIVGGCDSPRTGRCVNRTDRASNTNCAAMTTRRACERQAECMWIE